MERAIPEVVNVVIATRMEERQLERLRAVAPGRVNVIYAWNDFVPEMRREWPERSTAAMRDFPPSERSTAEIEAIVASMHVAYLGPVFPKALPKRAKNLLWGHYNLAGVSGLIGSDWWGAPFPVTSGRGLTSSLSCAEMVIGATFMLARRLNWAVESTLKGNFDPATYRGMMMVDGKTMGIVGLGGIGKHVARMARACGMRVLATRRSTKERQSNVEGVDELFPTAEMNEMLAECDFVTLSMMLTEETRGMIDKAAFAAIKPGAYMVNVARGQVVEEAAMIEALRSGHLAGVYTDVWDDDFAGPPSAALQAAPNVIISPRVGNRSDVSGIAGAAFDAFCDNLARLLKGEPLENVIDWERGY